MASKASRFTIRTTKSDTRDVLTSVVSMLHNPDMPGFIDTFDALNKQYRADAERIASLNKELSELRPAFVKYKELSAQYSEAEERFRVLLGITGYLLPNEEILLLDVVPGIAIESLEEERRKAPLWKVLRELIRQVVEMRVVELEAGLKQYGYKVSRQAIESAIDTHKDIFRSVRRGRERFVSLK